MSRRIKCISMALGSAKIVGGELKQGRGRPVVCPPKNGNDVRVLESVNKTLTDLMERQANVGLLPDSTKAMYLKQIQRNTKLIENYNICKENGVKPL